MSSRCGSIEDMSENGSCMYDIQFSQYNRKEDTFKHCVNAVRLQRAWGGSKSGGVRVYMCVHCG